jgi:hypothetical protein
VLDRDYCGAFSKITDFYAVMNIADSLILGFLCLCINKETFASIARYHIPSWLVCRACQYMLALHGGCVASEVVGAILGRFNRVLTKRGSFSGLMLMIR